MLQKITKHLLIGMFSKQNIWCLISSVQSCLLLKNYQSWMGTQSGGLKAIPQKLSYTLHNLALMSAFSMSTMSWEKELVKAKGIQLYRGINSSLPAKALGIQMQENQLLFTLGLICGHLKKHSFCKWTGEINIRSNAEGDETLTKDLINCDLRL